QESYRPSQQHPTTKAPTSEAKRVEPSAQQNCLQDTSDISLEADTYLNQDNKLHKIDDVLAGVNAIIAEWISDDPGFRDFIREETFKRGMIHTEAKDKEKDEKSVYEMYYDYNEAVGSMVSHRILAINRGEKEEVLKVVIEPPLNRIIE